MRDTFWAHIDSIKLLDILSIVLIMENTYNKNKYKQPLFEIIGMRSTELIFSIVFAYIEYEQADNSFGYWIS